MLIKDIFIDKALKPKMKTVRLADEIKRGNISAAEVLEFALASKDPVKASCIEAMEICSKDNPSIAGIKWLLFAGESLASKSPRVKWESARLIGNIAKDAKNIPPEIIDNLLANAAHEGTVVRWSAAYALGETYKLNSPLNRKLKDAFDLIIGSEEKNSIKKIYQNAIKDREKSIKK